MNILEFIKKDFVNKVNFEEDFLLIELKGAQKFAVKSLDCSTTFIICDSIDFCEQKQMFYFNCNDYCLLRKRASEIRDIKIMKCSQEEYEKECVRLEELFV